MPIYRANIVTTDYAADATPADVAAAGSIGTSTDYAREDHVHAHGTQAGGTLHADATIAVAGFMSATDKVKLDAVPATPSNIVTNAGTSTDNAIARFDLASGKIIQNSSATVDDTGNLQTTGDVQVGGSLVVTGLTGTINGNTIITVNDAGGAPPSVAAASAAGTSVFYARDDHTHGHGTQAGGTLHADATGAVAGFMSAADKTKIDTFAAETAYLLIDGTRSMTGGLSLKAGTSSAPAWYMGGDTTSGFYRSAANVIDVTLSTTRRWYFTGDAFVSARSSSNIYSAGTNGTMHVSGNQSTGVTSPAVYFRNGSTGAVSFTATGAGTQRLVGMKGTVNQVVSSAGFAALDIEIITTSLGGGTHRLISAKTGTPTASEVFAVLNGGNVLTADGSSSAPGQAFLAKPGTGWYRESWDAIGAACDTIAALGISAPSSGASYLYGAQSLFEVSAPTTLRLKASTETVDLTVTSLAPTSDNVLTLGADGQRWADVWAVTTTIGDLVMKDPHGGRPHLKLVEGEGTLHVYDVRNKRKYHVPLVEDIMTNADMAFIEAERARWVEYKEA